MADVNSNININFNTAAALAQLRQLQAGLSRFHQSLAEGNLAAANAQKGLNAQLLQSVGATGKFSASQVKVAGSTLAFTSALEKNKLSLREYYRYTMAAATANTRVMGKAFAQEREIINRARRDRVKALQAQYIQMNKANSGFMDAIRIMPKSLQMASGKFTELGTRIQYAAQRQQFLNQLLKQGSTQLLNFGKNTQWAGRQLMVGLTMPLALFGASAAKAFRDLDAEIVKFRRVYGDAFTNDAEVDEAIAGIRRLGTEYTKYGVSVAKTMEMAATAAAAGFTGSNLTAQVETATKLSVLGQVEQQQALETTISLQSAFGISSDELAKKIDFLNAVENQTLLSIEDLTIAIPKAAPVVKQLGGTVEDLAFFLTAMKEGGINASEGANALKSGLASLINPAEKSAKFLANLGINIKGIVEANAGDIKGTVVGFAQALDTLDPLNRARAIEQLFGKFQFSRLSTLFQNVTKEGSQASRALDLASSSIEELAVMSEREMKKIEESTGVKFQAAIENFKQEIMPLGKAFLEALTPVVKFFGSLFEKFNGLSDQTKKVVATIVGVVAGLGPIVLMTFGLLANGVANVIKFFAMLRGGIAKLNGQTSVMGASFNYMTQEQIENAASSQQLHQTHTRLIEVFNVEKASVSALASSYNSLSTQMRAMAAQNPGLFAGGAPGAARAVTKLPPVRKYAEGILSVPGPKGAGDVVPAMLSPGEAVIPTDTTNKYRGLISAMFKDKVPGFMAGRLPPSRKPILKNNTVPKEKPLQSENLFNSSGRLASNSLIKTLSPKQKKEYQKTLKTLNTYVDDKEANLAIDNALKMGVPKQLLGKALIKQWKDGMYPITSLKKYNSLTQSLYTKESGTFFRGTGVSGNSYNQNKLGTLPPEISGEVYKILTTLKGSEQRDALSRFIGKPFKMRTSAWTTNESIAGDFAKNARNSAMTKKDVIPFTVKTSIKDENVIPVHSLFKEKYLHKGVSESESMFGGNFIIKEINSKGIVVEKVSSLSKGMMDIPGFMAGRLPGGPGRGLPLSPGPAAFRDAQQAKYRRINDARQGYNEPHPERKSGPSFVGMPKSFEKTSQSRQTVEKIAQQVSLGRFGTLPPSNFGTLLQPFSGRSFPVSGVGGVYRKPNGQIVVVKPTIDDKTALAEVRATQIAREVHGLVSPKQSIRTMIDPTDPTGQRKFIVIESPYDPRIAAMSGKFSKSDMVKQLVASTLRGDRDLQQPNLSGNVLADVGTAGVFDRASGFRDFSKAMPSMEQQAIVNLLGVKGGAKKFFAQETSSTAAKMTPSQYDFAIKEEIKGSIPRLKNLINSWDDLGPEEQLVYGNMLDRLKRGAKTDWDKLHPMHVRAGEGVIKANDGINSGATPSEIKGQVSRYETATQRKESQTQINKLVEQLNKDIENTLKELKNTNPAQHKKALAMLEKSGVTPKADGSIDFKKSKVYSDFIAKNLFYKDGAFHTAKAIEKGQSPTTSAKTYDAIKDQILYRMNAAPKPGKDTFSNKPFTAGRLNEDLTSTTQSGGWRANIDRKSDLYKALDAAEKQHKARNIQNPKNVVLNNLRSQMLLDGYTVKQVDAMLRTELSHLAKTGEAGLGPEKWKKGFAKFDLRLLNSYVNPGGKPGTPVKNPRLAKILDWDARNSNVLFNPAQTAELKKALDFIKTGAHPVTESQAKLVQAAANAQVRADEHLKEYQEKNLGKKPKGFPDLGSVRQARAVSTLLRGRLDGGYYQGTPTIYRLGPGSVLASLDEYLYDKPNETLEKITQRNSKKAGPNLKADTGKVDDNRIVQEGKGKSVVTKSQAGRIARGPRGVTFLPGRNAGDPTITSQSTRGRSSDELSKAAQRRINAGLAEKARMLSRENKLSATQIQRTIERIRIQRTEAEVTKAKIHQEKQSVALAKKNAPAIAKAQIKEKRMARQQRIGVASGGMAMGLGMAGSGLMMAGQQTAGMAVMGASVVAGLAPMFAGMGPAGLIATGVAAVGASLWALNKHIDNAAKKQAEFIDSVSATAKKMDQVGQVTGKVGSSRAMEQFREKGSFNDYEDVNRAGSQFGDTFLESEVGKEMAKGFVDNMARFGSEQASQDFGLQLATYISDGVLTSDQAASIAEQIGVELGSRSYTTNIQAEVRNLIGPNGEDLINDALTVRTNIVQQANKRSAAELNALQQGGGRDNAARIAGLSLNNIEIAKAQNDATEWQYRKQIQILEKQLSQTTLLEKQLELKTKISELEGKMESDTKVTTDLLNKQIKAEMDVFKNNIQSNSSGFSSMFQWLLPGDGEEDAYFTGLKARVQERFKDTFPGLTAQLQKDLANISGKTEQAAERMGFAGRTEAQQFEVFANLMMGQGFTNPQQFAEFMKIYAGNEGKLSKDLQLAVETQGPEKAFEMLDFFTEFEDKALVQEIYADISTKDPKQFDKIGKALASLATMDDKEVNVEAFLKLKDASGKPIGVELLEKLANDLAIIEDMPDVTTKEAILKYFEQGAGKGMAGMDKAGLDALMSKWKNWDKLPDVAKKQAISNYKTIYETVFADPQAREDYARRIATETANEASQGGRSTYMFDYVYRTTYETLMKGDANQQAINIASAGAFTKVGETGIIDGKVPGIDTNDNNGKGAKFDPYANLLKRLKEVRNAAIDASGGIESLNKALAKGNATSIGNKYTGTEQQLQSRGYNQGFIDFIQGMDPKEQAKFMRTSYKAKKGKNKGKVMNPFSKKPAKAGTKAGQVFLSKDAKSIGSGFDALVSGEFNTQAQRQLKSLKYQEDAYKKLRSAGVDHLAAQRIISDEYLAQSISLGKITKEEIEKNAALSKEIVMREKINGLIQSGRDKANEQSMYLVDPKTEKSKVEELLLFFTSKNIKFGEGAIRDILGDPETLSALIAGMDDAKDGTEATAKAMDDLVASVKTLHDNSDIELAIKIVTQTMSETVNQGAEAAQRINSVLTGMYSNLTASQLGNLTSFNPITKVTKNTGAQAIANVGKRYSNIVDGKEMAAGATVPKIDQVDPATGKVDTKGFDSADTVRSVQKERAELGKTISIAQSNANVAQQTYSNIMDSIRSADEKLRKNIDAIEERFKTKVDGLDEQNDKIDKAQEVIDGFTEQEDELNKNNAMYSNDLALIDNLSDEINKKYDKQVEALETVNQLNQQIAQSQQQQLDLADALSQGDIAAAARAAQEMRATSAANQGDAMMQGLEKSRQNELGAVVGKESGLTRLQIEKEQFRISQELYKLETHKDRVTAVTTIKEAKKVIAQLEKDMAVEIKEQERLHAIDVKNLQDQATAAKEIADKAAATVTSLQSQDTALASIEDYLTAVAEEAAALDESTGFTLEDYLAMIEKFPNLVQLAEDYKTAIVNGQVASGKMNTDWTSILKSITDLPKKIDIESILTIVENVTRNITEYITTVYNTATGGNSNGNSGSGSDPSKNDAPGTAWVADGKGGWTKPQKPVGDYVWDDNKGWQKEGSKVGANTGDLTTAEQAASDAAEAAAEAKRVAAEKAAKERKDAEAAADRAAAEQRFYTDWGMAYQAKGGMIKPLYRPMGGIIPYFLNGGFAKGTDTVPAMLTPGEFVMSKYAVQSHGIDTMKAINSGKTTGGAVYNNTYALTVNAKTDANPNEIAQAVMSTIKQVDDRRIRGVSLNGR